jgi:hypothetical protein
MERRVNLVQLTTDPTLGGPALATAPLGSATSAGAGTPPAGSGAPLPALAPDGVGPSSALAGGLIGGGGGMSPGQGGFFGVIGGLLNQIGGLLNQFAAEANAEGPGRQTVGDGTFSSTGDPHLTETASVLDASGNPSTLNRRFDSMTGHDNLLSSQDFDGGYRVSTTVTTPDAERERHDPPQQRPRHDHAQPRRDQFDPKRRQCGDAHGRSEHDVGRRGNRDPQCG